MKRRAFITVVAGTAMLGAGNSPAMDIDYETFTSAQREPPQPGGGVPELVRLATLAPSGHNTQPWRFVSEGRTLSVHADLSRRTPVVDPDDHHLYVSLGAAAENLAIAGPALGMPGAVDVAADAGIAYRWMARAPQPDPLADAIPLRRSTRTNYDGAPLDPSTIAALETAGTLAGVRLAVLTAPAARSAMRDLVVEATGRQMDDPAFSAELKHWLRFSSARAMRSGDGLYAGATGNPVMPEFIGRLAFDLFFRKKAERDRYARQMDSSPALVVLMGERADPDHWIRVGRATQRLLLEATRRGLACAFVNQPVEVPSLRAELAAIAGEPALRPDLILRIGRAPGLAWSPRRPVGDVLTSSSQR